MWARVFEIVLGLWLAIAPMVLLTANEALPAMFVDIPAGGLVILFAVASFWPRTRHAHLATAGLAVALTAAVWLTSPFPAPALDQSRVLTALVLLMFAIVPNQASDPPPEWRQSVTARRL